MRCLIYAILPAAEAIEPLGDGLDGQAVCAVRRGDLAAVYSQVTDARIIPTAERALAYAEVVGRLHQQCPLLPMRYGASADGPDEVAGLLDRHHEELSQALRRVDGCVEMGVRIMTQPPAPQPAPQPAASGAAPADEAPAGARQYLMRRKALYEQHDAGQKQAQELLDLASGRLGDMCVDTRVTVSCAGAAAVSLAFLLPRERIAEFRLAIDCFKASRPEPVFISGPWPPYSFCPQLPT